MNNSLSSSAVNALHTHLDYMLLSGDDEGYVKLWDLRKKGVAHEWHVSSMFALLPLHLLQ